MRMVNKYDWYNEQWFQTMGPLYDVMEIFVRHIRTDVVKDSGLRRGSSVIDLACGTGAQSIAFAKNGFPTVGVDLSPYMVARAAEKVKAGWDARFVCHDATQTPFSDSEFELSTVSFGLHDMPETIGVAVLREMCRVTKRGGKLVIIDYSLPANRVSAAMGRMIAGIWEGETYRYFLDKGLGHYLNKVDLTVAEDARYLFGNVQKVTCLNDN